MVGYLGDIAPTDEHGYREYARTLAAPEIFDVIKDAEPVSALASYRFGASRRRYYEELARFPEGFLIFGDLESLALCECLGSGRPGLASRFFQAAGRLIDIPWHIAATRDLRHPEVKGRRTVRGRILNWYMAKLLRAAHDDPGLATKFLEVVNLIHKPTALLHPWLAFRVLRGNARLRWLALFVRAATPKQGERLSETSTTSA
jgi:hypothetical protein